MTPSPGAAGDRAIVVGAGIAGLTAAFRLRRAGYEVTVYESTHLVGGRMSTRERDGHYMDLAATALSTKYEAMLTLAADVGIADRIVGSSDIVAIPRNGELQRIRSSSSRDLLTTKVLPWWPKLRALGLLPDVRRVARSYEWHDMGAAAFADVETAAEWVSRKAHPEVDAAVTNALMRGGYLASSTTMSVLDLHFLINGFFGADLFSFARGVGTLPEALAGHVDLRLGHVVSHVEEDGAGVRVAVTPDGQSERVEEASVCVVAVPAPLMYELYPQLPGEQAEIVSRADYVPVTVVKLGLDAPPDESAMFIALPERESPDLGALFLEHVKCPDRSPAGRGQVGAYWDGRWSAEHRDSPDEDIVADTLAAVSAYLPGVEDAVEFTEVVRWQEGLLNSRPGSYRGLHRVAAAQDQARRVFLAGDYFGGPSTNAALCSGEKAAERILARR
jgi:protoporphyrinogen/coproporphyrinogen III oxidase